MNKRDLIAAVADSTDLTRAKAGDAVGCGAGRYRRRAEGKE